MQQDYPVTPTTDELRRAENGDPWAVLLVGILRTVPSNKEMKLTRTQDRVGLEYQKIPMIGASSLFPGR